MMSVREAEITGFHARALTCNPGAETINAVNATRDKLREITNEIRKLKHKSLPQSLQSLNRCRMRSRHLILKRLKNWNW
jgi:hypothetical protein